MAYVFEGRIVGALPLGFVRRNNPERPQGMKNTLLRRFLRGLKIAAKLAAAQRWYKKYDSNWERIVPLVQVKDYIDYEIDYHGLLLSAGITTELPLYGQLSRYDVCYI